VSADRLTGLLAPILDSAYRTALCLAPGAEEAETLLRDAARRALPRLGQLGAGDFRPWFLGIMLEVFRAGCRSATPAAPTPEADRLLAAIRALSPCERMVAALYFGDGLSCREIAVVLGCSVPAVRRRVGPLRASLRPVVVSTAVLGAPTPQLASSAFR
jgi:DNA-directed RNA polymerase specialized sigma24 family protein